jgi:hypothetical protein
MRGKERQPQLAEPAAREKNVDKTNWTQMYCGIFKSTQHQVREQDLAFNCTESVMNTNGMIALNGISERGQTASTQVHERQQNNLLSQDVRCQNRTSYFHIRFSLFGI